MPLVKAPRPDGFISAFYKLCWETIKENMVTTILHMTSLHPVNIIVFPKKTDATAVSDYMPISLIHNLTNIFSKNLANRLAPLLRTPISKV